jgi:hypothetical protein
VRERHGSAFYTAIGQKGGATTRERMGVEHYARIGHLGGQRAKHRESAADQQDTK